MSTNGRNDLGAGDRYFPDWLDAYCNTFDEKTEAPPSFLFWSGVSAAAGALTRRVVLDEVTYRFYPNFYIILVAPLGTIKKTTIIDLSMSILRDLSAEVPHIKFGADVTTAEAMWRRMAEASGEIRINGSESDPVGADWEDQCAMTFAIGEFGSFFQSDNKKLVNDLTDFYDGRSIPITKDTKTSGTDVIRNPFVNLIAGATPEFLRDEFKQQYGGWGLSSRIIFVYANKKQRLVYRPSELFQSDAYNEQRAKLAHDLKHISMLSGQFHFDERADDCARDWYLLNEEEAARFAATSDYDPWVGYFKARKQVHMHKLAMILSACRRDSLIITHEDVEDSIARVQEVEGGLEKIFTRPLQQTNTAQIEQGVWEVMHSMISATADGRIKRQLVSNRLVRYVGFESAEKIINIAIARKMIEQTLAVDRLAYLSLPLEEE